MSIGYFADSYQSSAYLSATFSVTTYDVVITNKGRVAAGFVKSGTTVSAYAGTSSDRTSYIVAIAITE